MVLRACERLSRKPQTIGRKVNTPRPISIGATKSQKVIVAEWSRRRRDGAIGADRAPLVTAIPAVACFAISVPSPATRLAGKFPHPPHVSPPLVAKRPPWSTEPGSPLPAHRERAGVRVTRLTPQNARQLLLTLLSRRRHLVGGRSAFLDDAGQRVLHDRIHGVRVLRRKELAIVVEDLDGLGGSPFL